MSLSASCYPYLQKSSSRTSPFNITKESLDSTSRSKSYNCMLKSKSFKSTRVPIFTIYEHSRQTYLYRHISLSSGRLVPQNSFYHKMQKLQSLSRLLQSSFFPSFLPTQRIMLSIRCSFCFVQRFFCPPTILLFI